MNTKINFLATITAAIFTITACSSSDDINNSNSGGNDKTNINANIVTSSTPAVGNLEFPKVKGGNSIIVTHYDGDSINYSVEWDTSKKSNRWSCYKMYWSIVLSRNIKRYSVSDADYHTKQYPSDPDINSTAVWTAGDGDPYWGQGYDHGHICPSADRLNSYTANKQTFYLTNMQPQLHNFNAGIWEDMENFVRNQITVNSNHGDTLYVCKGGVIDQDTAIYKKTAMGLIVPRYFFSAILMKNSSGYKAIGFWFDQYAATQGILSDHVVNIKYLEDHTGIDFFCNLPDATEQHVEQLSIDNIKRAWGFNN